MARLILIDPSLRGLGGHHYEYDVHTLRAAHALGLETVVAANRRFRATAALPPGCRVFPRFRYTTYSKYTLFSSHRRRLIDPPADAAPPRRTPLVGGLVDRIQAWRFRGGPARRVRNVEQVCAALFREVGIEEGDVVFVPTLSELELAALAEYWSAHPDSKRADWHLQFHFPVFDGREPDYDRQGTRLEALRAHMAASLAKAPDHRLHFYSTTRELCAQYDRLGLRTFEELPYPVSGQILEGTRGERRGPPLRVTCAGGPRAEKQLDELVGIAAAVAHDLGAQGRIQWVLQDREDPKTGGPRNLLPLPGATAGARLVHRVAELGTGPVAYLVHPLEGGEYAALIRATDVGLFLYDSERYYARRAGVMQEMLAVGAPVIVPAGCWLSEQVAAPIAAHHEAVRDAARVLGEETVEALACFGGADAPASARLRVPSGATHVHVGGRRRAPEGPGTYVRVEMRGVDGVVAAVSGDAAVDGVVSALFSLEGARDEIELATTNAFRGGAVELDGVQVTFLQADSDTPLGAVAQVAAAPGEVPRLLREVVTHIDHYRETAEAFAVSWRRRHEPARTLDMLLRNSAVGATAPRG